MLKFLIKKLVSFHEIYVTLSIYVMHREMRFLWVEHGERDLRNGGLEEPPKRRGDAAKTTQKRG